MEGQISGWFFGRIIYFWADIRAGLFLLRETLRAVKRADFQAFFRSLFDGVVFRVRFQLSRYDYMFANKSMIEWYEHSSKKREIDKHNRTRLAELWKGPTFWRVIFFTEYHRAHSSDPASNRILNFIHCPLYIHTYIQHFPCPSHNIHRRQVHPLLSIDISNNVHRYIQHYPSTYPIISIGTLKIIHLNNSSPAPKHIVPFADQFDWLRFAKDFMVETQTFYFNF